MIADYSSEIKIAIFQSISEANVPKEDNPLSDCKVIYQVNKPLHPSTNPALLVNIGPLDFEIPILESRRLKICIYKVKKKHRQNI